MTRKHVFFWLSLVAIVASDWWTKALIVEHLAYRDGFSAIDGFFNIVHARNRGAAFGLLNNADPRWVMPFFLTMGVFAMGFLMVLLKKVPADRRLLPLLLGAVGGGAVGNLVDRARWGYVVDFLDFYVGNWHWPAFNVADIGISVGVVTLFGLSLLGKDDGLFSDKRD